MKSSEGVASPNASEWAENRVDIAAAAVEFRHTRRQTERLTVHAVPASCRNARKQDTAPAPVTPTPFRFRNPAKIPPRRWLYGRRLVAGFVSLTVSPGGLGKSSLSLAEALAMVTGRPLLGLRPARPLRVWLWNGEDPRDELERRAAAACLHYDISAADLGERLYLDSGRDVPIRLAEEGRRGGALAARHLVEELVEAIGARDIDVLIVDPFATTHGVSENDNAAINAVAGLWREIADRTGAAVELVHHAQKAAIASGSEIGIAQSRGASALIDAVRSARFLVAMSRSEADRAGIVNPNGLFRVEDGKANLAPRSDKIEWFRMESVPLGNGSGLYPEGDLVGVVTRWQMPDAFEGVTVADLEATRAVIRTGNWKENEQARDWAGYAIAKALRLDIGPAKKAERTANQNAARAKVRSLLMIWLRTGELSREMRSDNRNGRAAPFVIVPDEA